MGVTTLSSLLRPILTVYFSMKYYATGHIHCHCIFEGNQLKDSREINLNPNETLLKN